MTKRNILRLTVFGILVIFVAFSGLPAASGLTSPMSIIDGTNDVMRFDRSTMDVTGGHTKDDIDITAIDLTPESTYTQVNISILGSFDNWDQKYWAHIYFRNGSFDTMNPVPFPYYKLWITFNFTDDLVVYLQYWYDTNAYHDWTGAGWGGFPENIGGYVDNTLWAKVPTGGGFPLSEGYTIPDGISYFAMTTYDNFTQYSYSDAVPNWDLSDTIPSYDIFIFIGAMIGISVIITRKRVKLKYKIR